MDESSQDILAMEAELLLHFDKNAFKVAMEILFCVETNILKLPVQ